jgi:toxin YoeB
VSWRVVFTAHVRRDAKKLAAAGLRPEAQQLLDLLETNPFQVPPPFQMLAGDLRGAFSRRINIQHRLVYEVIESERTVKVLQMWTHHE